MFRVHLIPRSFNTPLHFLTSGELASTFITSNAEVFFTRFPHHSSPISRERGNDEGRNMQWPSAPSSPKSKPPAAVIDKDLQIRHVKYASIDPTYRKPSGSKTHTRRRTERDEPHSLLMPPLTPLSSIRTTASVDSVAKAGVVPSRASAASK